MGALIEQAKKLIARCDDSSRDLGNQQAVFSQQFAQMKQWQSGAEQEISAGIACQKDLANRPSAKQSENQLIKEELHAMKAQNRNRTPIQFAHGDRANSFGVDSNVTGGGRGSASQNAPRKAYDFNSRNKTFNPSRTPALDQINPKIAKRKLQYRMVRRFSRVKRIQALDSTRIV